MNVYFQLTEQFNAAGPVAALASGQAVVFYRLAIMSKDGDWVIRETREACERVLAVLAGRGARYRLGAPLDVRWLAGGWSSHFELADERARRVRCDFVSRPPRVPAQALDRLFAPSDDLLVVDPLTLVEMKRTQRAKDYPVIAEVARLLPPDRELEVTSDPDRIIELARSHGAGSRRECVRLARAGRPRREVVVALAIEIDRQQEADRLRLQAYQRAAEPYLRQLLQANLGSLPLEEAHRRACELASRWLPAVVDVKEADSGDAE